MWAIPPLHIDRSQKASGHYPNMNLDWMWLPRARALRYQQQRSVSEIHQQLQQRGLCVSQRSVSHLLKRYDELLALGLSDKNRIQKIVEGQKRVILAIDGMQPDVGHEVLWVLRDCLPLRNSTGSDSTICENSRFSSTTSWGATGCSCTNCGSHQWWSAVDSSGGWSGTTRRTSRSVSFPLFTRSC